MIYSFHVFISVASGKTFPTPPPSTDPQKLILIKVKNYISRIYVLIYVRLLRF